MLSFEREIGNVGVASADDLAAGERAIGGTLRADNRNGAKLLEDRTKLRTCPQELLAEEAAAQRVVRVRGEDENAAAGFDTPDQRDMTVHVIGDGAGHDGLAVETRRIGVGEHIGGVRGGVAPVHGRGDGAGEAAQDRERVDAGRCARHRIPADDDVALLRIANIRTRTVARFHRRLPGEGETVLPGEIGAKDVRHVRAIDIEAGLRVGVAVGIGGALDARIEGPAIGRAESGDEILPRLFIRSGPALLGDAPRRGRCGAGE